MAKEVAPAWQEKICHATLTLGETELAGVDNPFEPHECPKGFQLILQVNQGRQNGSFKRSRATGQ